MEPMGLENGLLRDSHITASSYRSDDTLPVKVRLNSDTSWMPEWTDDEPFIQVKYILFQKLIIITIILWYIIIWYNLTHGFTSSCVRLYKLLS